MKAFFLIIRLMFGAILFVIVVPYVFVSNIISDIKRYFFLKKTKLFLAEHLGKTLIFYTPRSMNKKIVGQLSPLLNAHVEYHLVIKGENKTLKGFEHLEQFVTDDQLKFPILIKMQKESIIRESIYDQIYNCKLEFLSFEKLAKYINEF